MSFINSHRLIEFKNVLDLMVQQQRITEEEALALLKAAGLAKQSQGESWIDESGAEYSMI